MYDYAKVVDDQMVFSCWESFLEKNTGLLALCRLPRSARGALMLIRGLENHVVPQMEQNVVLCQVTVEKDLGFRAAPGTVSRFAPLLSAVSAVR
jgi:hypothetical protein